MLAPLEQFRAEVRRRLTPVNDNGPRLFLEARAVEAVAMEGGFPPVMAAGELVHHVAALTVHIGATDVDQITLAEEIRRLLAVVTVTLQHDVMVPSDVCGRRVAGAVLASAPHCAPAPLPLSEGGASAPTSQPAAGHPPSSVLAACEAGGAADDRSAAGTASFTIQARAGRDEELAAIEAFVQVRGVRRDPPKGRKHDDLEEICRRLIADGHVVRRVGRRGFGMGQRYEVDGIRMGPAKLRRFAASLPPTHGPERE